MRSEHSARRRAGEKLRRRAKHLATRGLVRVLQRVAGRAPVIVPEYDLHPRARWGWDGPPAPDVAAILAAGDPSYEPFVEAMLELTGWARGVTLTSLEGEPAWENNFWGGVDAVAQVAALRRRNPRTYMEVGSGHSTRFARRAIRDFGLRTRIVSIDPQPRADVDALCDTAVRRRVEDADLAIFDSLEAGDVLLIDGSHMAFMGSDAALLFVEVLPRLAPGVLVGIDDVFLPWDYPPTWAGRFYSEQYLLAAFLLGGAQGWAVRFPAWHVTRASPLGERLDPLWAVVESSFGRLAASFWMERTG